MLKLRFVVDGPREFQTVPLLVQRILGIPVEAAGNTVTWRDIPTHTATGRPGVGKLGRKLLAAVDQARGNGADGLVATIDLDKPAASKLDQLRKARDFDREHSAPFPTALGEAKPHFEAWLLDDPVAVRRALGMPADAEIPPIGKTRSPKHALDNMISQREGEGPSTLATLAVIAEQLETQRCVHAEETGFKAFRQDLLKEFRSFRGA